nr:unnamed protein product [Digitaria exilis]
MRFARNRSNVASRSATSSAGALPGRSATSARGRQWPPHGRRAAATGTGRPNRGSRVAPPHAHANVRVGSARALCNPSHRSERRAIMASLAGPLAAGELGEQRCPAGGIPFRYAPRASAEDLHSSPAQSPSPNPVARSVRALQAINGAAGRPSHPARAPEATRCPLTHLGTPPSSVTPPLNQLSASLALLALAHFIFNLQPSSNSLVLATRTIPNLNRAVCAGKSEFPPPLVHFRHEHHLYVEPHTPAIIDFAKPHDELRHRPVKPSRLSAPRSDHHRRLSTSSEQAAPPLTVDEPRRFTSGHETYPNRRAVSPSSFSPTSPAPVRRSLAGARTPASPRTSSQGTLADSIYNLVPANEEETPEGGADVIVIEPETDPSVAQEGKPQSIT